MNTKKNRFLWIFLLFAIALSLSWEMISIPDAKARLDALPSSGSFYSSQTLPLSKQEKQIFAGCHMVKRIYKVDNQKVFVSIVDGTKNRNAVHDPSVCFTGGGWSVVKTTSLSIPKGTIDILTLKKEKNTQEVLVWFSEGDRIYSSALTYWARTALRRISYGKSGPEPVRVVVQPLFSKQRMDWEQLLQKFPELLQV